jgi:hypothetical protein
VTSHWAFEIGVLSRLVVLIHTHRVSGVYSTLKFLFVRLQWLSADTTLRIISSDQSAYASLTALCDFKLLELAEVLSELIGHDYWSFFFYFLLL